jgi:hypothetical protein
MGNERKILAHATGKHVLILLSDFLQGRLKTWVKHMSDFRLFVLWENSIIARVKLSAHVNTLPTIIAAAEAVEVSHCLELIPD